MSGIKNEREEQKKLKIWQEMKSKRITRTPYKTPILSNNKYIISSVFVFKKLIHSFWSIFSIKLIILDGIYIYKGNTFITWRHSSLTITQFNGNTELLVSKTEEAGQIFFYISSAFRFIPWAEIQNESCAIVTSDFKFQMYVFKSQT